MEIQHSFIKGMNRDLSKDKFPHDAYYYLLNGRVINDDNATLSDIVNLKGNTEANINDNSLVRDNYSIIGYTNIQNDIILFYAQNTATGIDSLTTYSIIDRLVYQGNNVYLREQIWNGQGLNFRIDKKIRAVSIYESTNVEKIYWTDYNNNIRQANIAIDISTQTANQFDIIGDFIGMYAPTFNDYISGSLKPGSIAYAYRLVKKNGYRTVFSNVSNIIPVGKNIAFGQNINKAYGDEMYDPELSYNSFKGVKIDITFSNTDYYDYYDYIEVVSLWYSSDSAIPDINIIDKIKINSDISVYKIVDTGTNSYGTLTLVEFTNQNYSFTAKDLVIKDDRLFAANITEEYFDLDTEATWTGKTTGDIWDARAYRFTSLATGRVAELLDENLSTPEYTLDGANPDYDSVAPTAQAINIYNNITSNVSDELNSIGQRQMYMENGTWIGGSGKNISYTLTATATNLLNYHQTLPEIVGTLDNEEQLGIYKGFQRDEVYRFGIVFFDKKGRQSFVKWIGDIRMTQTALGYITSGDESLNAYSLYPLFFISNIPTINGEVLDWQIVYVKREEKDKGVVAAGLLLPTINTGSEVRPCTTMLTIGDYNNGVDLDGHTINKQIFNFISPEINFRKTEVINGTFIAIAGDYETNSYCLHKDLNDPSTTWSSMNRYDSISTTTLRIYIRRLGSCLTPLIPERLDIVDFVKTIPSTVLDFVVDIDSESYAHTGYRDTGGGDNTAAPGGTCLTIKVDDVLTSGSVINNNWYAYLRKNVFESQYNGLTYSVRQSNTYIPASPKISGSTSYYTCKYGDTFVTMFEYNRFAMKKVGNISKFFSEMTYITCESSINTLFTTTDTYSRKYTVHDSSPVYINEEPVIDSNTGLAFTGMYGYNSAYNKLEDSKKFVAEPSLFENITENFARIKYSDIKINNEDLDSWLIFDSNNYNDANENYGSINRLIEFNDKIFCFQNNAVSLVSINPRVTQQSTDGINIVLGTGDIIDKFNYLTTEIGCQDNSDIIKSFQALYWLDKNKRKIYTFNGQIESISDLKGLHSYFKNNIYESSEFIGTYDVINSEVLMTVSDENPKTEFLANFVVTSYYDYDGYPGYDGYYSIWDLLGNTSIIEIPFVVGRIYRIGNGWFTYISKTDTSYRFGYSHGTDLVDGVIYDLSNYITERDNFTLVYNEKIQAFTSFYSFLPDLYIRHNRDYFTSQNSRDLWQHNIGEDYNTFYGISYPTTIKLISNFGSQIQSEYTNIKFFAEIWDQYGNLIPNETFSNISIKDSTQISEDIILYPIHLNEEYKGDRYVLDTSGLRIGRDWYAGLTVRPEGLVISNNQLYRNTSIDNLTTQPPAPGWSVAELCNIRKTNNHWMTNLPRFYFRENTTNDYEYGLSNRFRSNWLEITLEFKDMMPGINLSDRRIKLSDIKLVYTPLQF